jgi:hypothetical protein
MPADRDGPQYLVLLVVGPEQDGHGRAAPGGQLLSDPAGERVFPADDEMVAAGRAQGPGRHGVILTGPIGRHHHSGGAPATPQ